MRSTIKPASWLPLCAALAIGTGTAAADDTATLDAGVLDAAVADAGVPDARVVTPPSSRYLDVPNPEGSYTARIGYNGTGCPLDTIEAQISADGKVFSFDLDAFEASLPANVRLVARDCHLTIMLRSVERRAFAVTSLRYAGVADLAAGAQLVVQGRWYASGVPVILPEGRTVIEGPYDDDFELVEDTPPEDRVYIPCGHDRSINVPLRLSLRASQRDVRGTAKFGGVPDQPALRVAIDWKACE